MSSIINYRKHVSALLEKLPHGAVTMQHPDGLRSRYGHPLLESDCIVRVSDNRFYRRLAWDGDIGLAESYIAGEWTAHDPAAFIYWLLQNREYLPQGGRLSRILGSVRELGERLRHRLRANTLSGSRDNIIAHYDLGNDFYRLFLDPSMTYSSAFFTEQAQTLEAAQREKYARLCRQLALKKGMQVLEIGCGWGGFAEYAAQEHGCQVTGITLSPAQLEYARERIAHAGLEDLVVFELCDYREQRGHYDAIVSIEMLEAVGHKYLPEFFAKCERLLTPDGVLALQVITCSDSRYEAYCNSSDFIRKHVFPGGHLPSLGAMQTACTASSRFDITALESFGQHYAKTLRLWRERFEANWPRIESQGFDVRFRRLWRMYLAYCEAAFEARHINVVQCFLTRPNEAGLPSERVPEMAARDCSPTREEVTA